MSKTGYFLEDLSEGMRAEIEKTVTDDDIITFARISGDTNPVHLDETYAKTTIFKSRIAHGMLTAGLVSAVIGTELPGPGAIYLEQTLKFRAPVRIGDTVTAAVAVTAIEPKRRHVTLECIASIGETVVLKGEAKVMVPSRAA